MKPGNRSGRFVDRYQATAAHHVHDRCHKERTAVIQGSGLEHQIGAPANDQFLINSEVERALPNPVAQPTEIDGVASALSPAPIIKVLKALDDVPLLWRQQRLVAIVECLANIEAHLLSRVGAVTAGPAGSTPCALRRASTSHQSLETRLSPVFMQFSISEYGVSANRAIAAS